MATISYKNMSPSAPYGAVVEVGSRGNAWKYSPVENFTIVSKCEDLDEETQITFVPLRILTPIDDDKIIVWGLGNKWNVREADWYNNWRKECKDKWGYDIHERLYTKNK
jgi:hypothetical protein